MVSIYNNNFTTPESRVPYFIEVYRCVEADSNCAAQEYPVPLNKTEIEIVVPDLTNSCRDPLIKKFYKYVVYNHTSCKCGKLDKKKTLQESESKIRETRMTGCYLVSNMCTKAPCPLIARINS